MPIILEVLLWGLEMSSFKNLKSRILICGGREYNDVDSFYHHISQIKPYFTNQFCFIQGGANGADFLAKDYARVNGIPMLEVPAGWDYYGRKAGMIRNKWMLDYCKPDLVIAFPGGVGTNGMVKLAEQYGIDIYHAK